MSAAFAIFTDETPGFDPNHAGLKFTIAVVFPGRRAGVEVEIAKVLGPAVEPWGLPYHGSAATRQLRSNELRDHLRHPRRARASRGAGHNPIPERRGRTW